METNKVSFGKKLKKMFTNRGLFMVWLIAATVIIMTIISPNFFRFANFASIFIGLVPDAIIAIGMTITLVMGTFDLSVGGILALTGTLVGVFMLAGVPIIVSILITLILGSLLGLLNGLFIAKIGVNPLIATFGMQSIARSISLVITEGYSIFGLPKDFDIMGNVYWLGLPLMVWVMFALVIVGDILLRRSRYFRQIFYIGGNTEAAKLSGINVDRTKIMAFTISALCATVAGIILASRLMAGTPTAGQGIELSVIAAGVIGGASLNGGEGTVIGTALGVIFLGLVSNALVMMSVSVYWHGVVNGVILITAVSVDMILKARKAKLAAKNV